MAAPAAQPQVPFGVPPMLQARNNHLAAQAQNYQAQIAAAQGLAQLQGLLQNAKEDAKNHLAEVTFGKIRDAKYVQYCRTILSEWCDTRHIFDSRQRLLIIHESIAEHLDEAQEAQIWTAERIQLNAALNETTEGVWDGRVWWNPLTWHRVFSLKPQTSTTCLPVRTSFSASQVVCAGLAGAALMMGASYLGFKVYRRLINTSTTLSHEKQLLLPMTAAIEQLCSTITKKIESDNCISTSNSLDVIHASTQDNSTVSALTIQLSAKLMSKLWSGLKQAAESIAELHLLQRLKNFDPTSIKPPE